MSIDCEKDLSGIAGSSGARLCYFNARVRIPLSLQKPLVGKYGGA